MSRNTFLPHRWFKSPIWGFIWPFLNDLNNLHMMTELCFPPILLHHSSEHDTTFSPVTGITCWQVKFLQTTDTFIFLHYTFKFTLLVHDLTAILEVAFAGVEAAKPVKAVSSCVSTFRSVEPPGCVWRGGAVAFQRHFNVTPWDIFRETSGQLAAMFVATQKGILSLNMILF